MEDKIWLGIDVSKERLDAVLMRNVPQRPKTFPNHAGGWKAMTAWLSSTQSGPVHVCMEATGRYGEGVATALFEAGFDVSIVNPFQIKSFGKIKLGRNKTDPIDAALIADYCRLFSPPRWTPPTATMKRLRELVRVRESLKAAIVQWTNRSKAGEIDSQAMEILANVVASLRAELTRADAAVMDAVASEAQLAEDYRLLTSIPAIGPQSATVIMVELPGRNVIRTTREAVAYAGLNPCRRQSGQSEGPTRISRIGNAKLRKALYLPALSSFHCNPSVRILRKRHQERGRLRPQQIATAAMRKLLHLCFGVLKTRTPYDPAYAG